MYTGFNPDPLPPEVEKAITTPHDHEGPDNRPLWIIWKVDIGRDGLTDGLQVDSIADSEHSARYHIACLLDEVPGRAMTGGELLAHVERVPANHRFGLYETYKFREFVERRISMKRYR